jgi:hypothetical protein
MEKPNDESCNAQNKQDQTEYEEKGASSRTSVSIQGLRYDQNPIARG